MRGIAGMLILIFSWGLPVHAASPGFVSVPAGELTPFWLKPQKEVIKYKVPALQVQIHQVTNQDFIEFLKTQPQWRKSQVSPLMADAAYLDQFQNDLKLKAGVNPRSPVTSVSWFAARAYCQNLGARLPTMSEWEYFAAASETKADANRDPKFLQRILDWYGETRPSHLPPVQSVYRNLYGINDAHGLVWEWVEDFNSGTGTGESRENGSLNRDLFCGAGSMSGGDPENYAAFMRFAFRSSLKGTSSIWNLGFRCVKGGSP